MASICGTMKMEEEKYTNIITHNKKKGSVILKKIKKKLKRILKRKKIVKNKSIYKKIGINIHFKLYNL